MVFSRARGRVRTFIAALGLAVSGCATFSPDGGLGPVGSLAGERLGTQLALPDDRAGASLAADTIKGLLSQPLTMDAAVQLAVLNNPGLRASFSGLGIAEADLVQAGRLSNPVFSFSNNRSSEAQSIERTLLVNLLSLVDSCRYGRTSRGRQFQAAQLELAADIVRLAGDTRKAWVSAVAAQESVRYFEQVAWRPRRAPSSPRRMARVGNFSKLAQMREQAFYADATAQLARAQQAAVAERERLTRLLGLSGRGIALQLPERLPDLPAAPLEPTDAEQTAMRHAGSTCRWPSATPRAWRSSLGLTSATRFVNVLEVGYTNE